MSKYSHLIDEPGDPVRVLEGKHYGKVGQVIDFFGGKVVLELGGVEVAFDRDQLEPLFDLETGITLKLPEVEKGSDLADKVKPFGLTPDDLADFSREFILECMGRIKGAGFQQYYQDGFQKFEGMELDDLLEYAEEEILDIPNYCAMLFIRIRRLRQALDAVDELGRGTEEEYEGGNITADDFKEDHE